MNKTLLYFIRLNGIYDIICALSILQYLPSFLINNIHLSMIDNYSYNNKIFERFFAYWILTYGIIRFLSREKDILIFSYLIEAIVFINEFFVNKNMNSFRSLFVIVFSIFIAEVISYMK